MKLFDKSAEKKVWIALIASIPMILIVLHQESGEIRKKEILITLITIIIGIVLLYIIKWYSNKT